MTTRGKHYTPKQVAFLRAGYMAMNARDLAAAFNSAFGLEKTESQIKAALQNHKIRCGRKGADRLITPRRLNTPEQEQFIRDNYSRRSAAEMTDLFNEHFGTDRTLQQIKSFVHNHGIVSGRTGRFEKGNRPWNTGTKGLTGPNSESFKKGNVPANRKPLWSERVYPRDGVLMKVPEKNPYTGFPTRYKHKHVYVWEQAHGPVPDGMVVAFKDGDKLNCKLKNLMLITRAELLILNQHGYRDMPAELKPNVRTLVRLKVKAWERRKSVREELSEKAF